MTVKPLLQQLADVSDVLMRESDEPAGPVVFGMPSSLMATLGASCAQRFLEQYPKASLHLYEGSSGLLLDRLENGLIGAAVLYESRRGQNMLVTPLLIEELYLVSRWTPEGGDYGPVSLTELARQKLILPGPQSGLRRTVEAGLKSADVSGHVLMDMHSVTVIKNLVEKGVGSTILPYGAVHREVADRHLSVRAIPLEIMHAKLFTATATGQPITRAMQAFLALLMDEVQRCISSGLLRGKVGGEL